MSSWLEYTTVTTEEFTAIHHHKGDPFSILGLHTRDDLKSLRLYHPEAHHIHLHFRGELLNVMKLGDTGFFEIKLPLDTSPKSYLVEIFTSETHSFISSDPYSFLPVLGDFDIHLIQSGTQYELYNKLGANPATHEGYTGVHFAVWAPNATGVSVVGGFNSWDGRRTPMRPLGSCGIWEIFIPDIASGEYYKFEIFTPEGNMIPKLDPLAKLSEPRPSQCNIVYDNTTYKWLDNDWMRARTKTHHNIPMSIYEMHLGSWKCPHDEREFHNYREIADLLIPYLKEMRYTHIELMPLLEHPLDESWGYQVTGYFSATSRYGNPDDLKYFIDQLHRNGIGVFLDWVPAHFPKDGLGLAKFDGSALYEHVDSRQGEHPHWGTLIFNYGRREVSNFLIASALFWLKEYHIDGLRVDAVASMLYLDYGKNDGEWVPNAYGNNTNFEAIEFLKHLNSIIRKELPGCLMIAEESTSFPNITTPPEEGGLGFHYKWNMGWMNDILHYFSQDPIYRKYHQNNLSFGLLYAFSEKFILVFSHDEVVHGKGSMMGKMPGDEWQRFANLRALYSFMFAHPGKKLNFMGNELGQYREWRAKGELDWNLLQYKPHAQVQGLIRNLNEIYQHETAFWELDENPDGFQWLDCDDGQNSTLGFARKNAAGDLILVLCNFTPVPREGYRFGVPNPGHYREIFNSDSKFYGGSNLGNLGGLTAESVPWNHFQYSISVNLPPLAVIYLKLESV